MPYTTLISVLQLAGMLHDPALVVMDCRFSLAALPEGGPDAGRRQYRQGHIPGARYAHLEDDLSDMRVRGAGRHPWPDAAAFAQWLGAAGIGTDTQVVAYDAGDGAFAARLWCLLQLFGHRAVAVLDGGFAAWTAAGQPVESGDGPPPNADASAYPGQFDHRRIVDADGVRAALQRGDVLLDARAAERFRGTLEPIDAVAGHVPGAVNRPYSLNLADGRFRSADELEAAFSTLLAGRQPQHAIVMCGSGVTACHHLLAMAHAGLEGARLYAGSWSGWISDPSRPIATGD
ncbi:MAG: sulfurtransferase [Pseudoxanthomonas suwonensis]|nr:MAG: sulfurtransferase [Pseudoxanthomonas suwonensis]